MPIRLNLLAEAQAELEIRRRDPVKRGIWIGILLVCLVLIWSGTMWIRIISHRATLNGLEGRFSSKGAQFQKIMQMEKDLADLKTKLKLLNNISTNRLLWGTVLNALQQSALPEVQLVHFRGEQSYPVSDEVKPKTTESGRVTIGKPGGITQKLTLVLDAKDTSANPGDQIENYKTALAKASFLGKDQPKTNAITFTLKNLSAPTYDAESGKSAMSFGIECRFADRNIK